MSTGKNNVALIFSERLKIARGRIGLNKAQIARELGFSAQRYQRYEEGRIPDAVTLDAIAKRVGVTVDWLLGRSDITPVDQWLELAPASRLRQLLRGYKTRAEIAAALNQPESIVDDLLRRAPTPAEEDTINRLMIEAGLVPPSALKRAQAVRESPADVCRYPADCNLPERIAAIENNVEALGIKLDTLLGLLGGAMKKGLKEAAEEDSPGIGKKAG